MEIPTQHFVQTIKNKVRERKKKSDRAENNQDRAPLEVGDSVKLYTTCKVGKRGDEAKIIQFHQPFVVLKLQPGEITKWTRTNVC